MGISDLYNWLKSKCKPAFKKRSSRPEALFVDLPAITYSYYDRPECMKDGVPNREFYRCVIGDVLKIVEKINPSRLVYLGQDGVEMPAKDWEKKSRAESGPKRERKSPYIYFPDTDESFDKNMRAEIRRRSGASAWKNIEVVYDPGQAPKEAEHKFIDCLRCNQEARNMEWVIFSGDSDFILLTLALGMSKVWISYKGEMEWNIGDLRREIAKLGYGTNACVDDFVFLMSMAKNDFLPGIASIDDLHSAYTKISDSLVTGGRINTDALKKLWKNLNNSSTGQVDARQRCMAECYIHGIHWFADLYFGVRDDWGWFYPFPKEPSVQSLIMSLEGFEARDPVLEPAPFNLHHWKVREEATDEQIMAAFREVFGHSLDDILPEGESEQMREVKARVYGDMRATNALVAIFGLSGDAKYIPRTPGILWVYSKFEKRETQDDVSKLDLIVNPPKAAISTPSWQNLRLRVPVMHHLREP